MGTPSSEPHRHGINPNLLRHERLPVKLFPAQHEYFGAHTYERVDQPRGEFSHTNWTGTGGRVASRTYTV